LRMVISRLPEAVGAEAGGGSDEIKKYVPKAAMLLGGDEWLEMKIVD